MKWLRILRKNPPTFEFPRADWASQDVNLFSFQKNALLEVLGEYSPSKGAVVINPLETGVAYPPQATALHEMQHQFLMINTSFGLFTGLLTRFGPGVSLDTLRECMRRQWFAQELAATYAEIGYIAVKAPQLFERSVRGLPSIRLNQPPYREAFDAMQRHLPLVPGKPEHLLTSQRLLVVLLAYAAMNSDCLLRMHPLPESEAGLVACMEDAPNTRLERIISLLVGKDLLGQLLDEAMDLYASDEVSGPSKAAPLVFRRIIELLPEVTIHSHESVVRQFTLIRDDLRANGVEFEVQLVDEPLPSIRNKDERHERVLAANPPQKMATDALSQRLALTTRQGLGLSLEFSVRGPDDTFVTALSYFLKPGQAPNPSTSKEDELTEPLPPRFQGVMPISEILRELEAFPDLPHVAVFVNDSRPRWNEIPGARARVANLVQVCRQTDLSFELIRDNILGFEGLGEDQGAQFLIRRGEPEEYDGYFFNPRRPLLYGVQSIPTELGVNLFLAICKRLGVPNCSDKRPPAFPLETLIQMVSTPLLMPRWQGNSLGLRPNQ